MASTVSHAAEVFIKYSFKSPRSFRLNSFWSHHKDPVAHLPWRDVAVTPVQCRRDPADGFSGGSSGPCLPFAAFSHFSTAAWVQDTCLPRSVNFGARPIQMWQNVLKSIPQMTGEWLVEALASLGAFSWLSEIAVLRQTGCHWEVAGCAASNYRLSTLQGNLESHTNLSKLLQDRKIWWKVKLASSRAGRLFITLLR